MLKNVEVFLKTYIKMLENMEVYVKVHKNAGQHGDVTKSVYFKVYIKAYKDAGKHGVVPKSLLRYLKT